MRSNLAKLFFCLFVSTLSVLGAFDAHAHGSTGEYAGTHVVALVAEPRSPFVGENVSMEFYLRDLRRIIDKKPFSISVKIHETTPSGEEKTIFSSLPEIISGGIYKLDYRFSRPGKYNIEYNFWPPENSDVTREAIFEMEVRNAPISIYSILTIAVAFLFVGILIGTGLRNITGRVKK